jgi:hypothetical protein
MSDPREQFYDDVHAIRDAVSAAIKTDAYMYVAGADGCAQCTDRSPAESISDGHIDCALDHARMKVLTDFAEHVKGGDLWIEIARAMEDPRMFQWVGKVDA